MKREHITLPTLQFAAAAFFFTSVQAKVKCVDETSTIVAASNCDGTQPANTFFLVPGRDSDVKVDAADPVARKAAGFSEAGLVSGGFGRRQEPTAPIQLPVPRLPLGLPHIPLGVLPVQVPQPNELPQPSQLPQPLPVGQPIGPVFPTFPFGFGG